MVNNCSRDPAVHNLYKRRNELTNNYAIATLRDNFILEILSRFCQGSFFAPA